MAERGGRGARHAPTCLLGDGANVIEVFQVSLGGQHQGTRWSYWAGLSRQTSAWSLRLRRTPSAARREHQVGFGSPAQPVVSQPGAADCGWKGTHGCVPEAAVSRQVQQSHVSLYSKCFHSHFT